MEKELYEKLMNVLCEKGVEQARDKEKWQNFYDVFVSEKKIDEDNKFQILYTIIDIDSLAKNHTYYGEADKILASEKSLRSEFQFKTIITGLTLLKNGNEFVKYTKNVNAVIESSKARTKNHEKWIEFCENYHSNNKFDVIYAIVNLDNIADNDNSVYAKTKSALKIEKQNIKNKQDYEKMLEGLRLFKNGGKFIRFMNDHKNDNSNNKHRNNRQMVF